MMRLSSLVAAAALLFMSSVLATEVIVSDSDGNIVGLPTSGGYGITNIADTATTIPFANGMYQLNVFVNDNNGETESFYINKPNNGTLYGAATFTSSYYNVNQNAGLGTANSNLFGNATKPNTATGLYTYFFSVPRGTNVSVQLTYNQTSPAPVPVSDQVSITVTNPIGVVGDPQFVGLRGQAYQVHGIDGAVYNLISSKSTQVNSRFAFLSEGQCPVVNGVAHSGNCWSHPGSYLGEMSFQQKVDGKIHSALVQAGSAKKGFDMIQVDGQVLAVGDRKAFGSFSVKRTSTHHVSITTEEFNFELDNSDMFINQAVAATVPLAQLKAHGLLGQTHAAKVYPTSVRYIEGEVDDYSIADSDLFGTDFVHNQF